MLSNIYIEFCKHIKNTFFTDERKGEQFILVIDDEYIDKSCKILSVTKEKLFQSVKAAMYTYQPTAFDDIIGILAIQIYAAFQRQTDDSATNKAYYIRLKDLLRIPIEDLETWMKSWQDDYWRIFYQWCRENDYYTHEIKPSYEAYRYVNYPLSQALLNTEDLKAMRYIFHFNQLIGGEDIDYEDFKSILFPLSSYPTPRFKKLYTDKENTELINQQIYYYYLHWDGNFEEKWKNTTRTVSAGSLEYTLNLTPDLTQ